MAKAVRPRPQAGGLATIDQASEMLMIGRTKVYEMILSGELRSVTLGRARRVPVEAIQELIRGGQG